MYSVKSTRDANFSLLLDYAFIYIKIFSILYDLIHLKFLECMVWQGEHEHLLFFFWFDNLQLRHSLPGPPYVIFFIHRVLLFIFEIFINHYVTIMRRC